MPCSVQKVTVLRSEFRLKRLLNTALCLFATVLHCMQSYTGRNYFLSCSNLTNSLVYGTDSFNSSCFLDLLKSGIYCLKKLYLIHPTCYLRHEYVVLAFCDCLLLVTTASVALLVVACAYQSSILSNCSVILWRCEQLIKFICHLPLQSMSLWAMCFQRCYRSQNVAELLFAEPTRLWKWKIVPFYWLSVACLL